MHTTRRELEHRVGNLRKRIRYLVSERSSGKSSERVRQLTREQAAEIVQSEKFLNDLIVQLQQYTQNLPLEQERKTENRLRKEYAQELQHFHEEKEEQLREIRFLHREQLEILEEERNKERREAAEYNRAIQNQLLAERIERDELKMKVREMEIQMDRLTVLNSQTQAENDHLREKLNECRMENANFFVDMKNLKQLKQQLEDSRNSNEKSEKEMKKVTHERDTLLSTLEQNINRLAHINRWSTEKLIDL